MRFFLALICIFCHQLYALTDIEKLLSEASSRNAYFLYEDAVKLLDEAIQQDPQDKEAYKERAFSHFELNHLDLALKDYECARNPQPPYGVYIRQCSLIPSMSNTSPSLDFAKGLLYGAMLGGGAGSVEFVSSIRGGLTFLWSFACSPIDVSKELIEALHEIGLFLASGRVDVLLQEALPELFECREYWHTWSEYVKGQKLGFIIGKYSILAFYYIATPNSGVYCYNKLKRANIMAILERYSVTRSAHILEASAQHAKKSTSILQKAAAGRVVPHNPNVLPHVFAPKHHWNKFIEITGNWEKDFETLAKFLENQKIFQCTRKLDYKRGGVITYKYTKEIGMDTIVALFEINTENVPFLRNAWVEVGVPYGR